MCFKVRVPVKSDQQAREVARNMEELGLSFHGDGIFTTVWAAFLVSCPPQLFIVAHKSSVVANRRLEAQRL